MTFCKDCGLEYLELPESGICPLCESKANPKCNICGFGPMEVRVLSLGTKPAGWLFSCPKCGCELKVMNSDEFDKDDAYEISEEVPSSLSWTRTKPKEK